MSDEFTEAETLRKLLAVEKLRADTAVAAEKQTQLALEIAHQTATFWRSFAKDYGERARRLVSAVSKPLEIDKVAACLFVDDLDSAYQEAMKE